MPRIYSQAEMSTLEWGRARGYTGPGCCNTVVGDGEGGFYFPDSEVEAGETTSEWETLPRPLSDSEQELSDYLDDNPGALVSPVPPPGFLDWFMHTNGFYPYFARGDRGPDRVYEMPDYTNPNGGVITVVEKGNRSYILGIGWSN